MLSGLDVSVAVWTYYGEYSRGVVDMLLSLPVHMIGFDFVWDPSIRSLLSKTSHDKGIGIGLIDSGDRGYIQLEPLEQILNMVSSLKGCVDLDKAFLSSNATLEHLPRDYARRKVALIGEATRRINQ
jgi:methionine synthase II (cobalamin-independent)